MRGRRGNALITIAVAALLVACTPATTPVPSPTPSPPAPSPPTPSSLSVTPTGPPTTVDSSHASPPVRPVVAVRVGIRAAGAGSHVVILIHGGPGLAGNYLFSAFRSMAGPSLRVVSYDQRGVGLTPDDGHGDYRFAAMVADLEALRVRLHADRIDLVGHAWGAMLAAAYTAAHPDRVERLVSLDGSPLDPGERLAGVTRMGNHIADLQKAGLIPNPLPDISNCVAGDTSIAPAFLANPRTPRHAAADQMGSVCSTAVGVAIVQIVNEGTDELHSIAEALTSWHGRALVIQGAADAFGLPWLHADASQYPAAQVSTLVVPAAGHLVWQEDPPIVNTIRDFLTRN